MVRVVRSLEKLRFQLNEAFPDRSKESDGGIGDEAHAARKSDHNPDSRGLVHARDFTHDPRHGLNSEQLAQTLKAHHDPRIKYIISNRKIWNPSVSPDWRPYNGSNPHDHHVHVSVLGDEDNPGREDDETPWNITMIGAAPRPDPSAPPAHPVYRVGSSGPAIADIWGMISNSEKSFGPVLEAAVEAYQKTKGLHVDGVVGPETLKSLRRTGGVT